MTGGKLELEQNHVENSFIHSLGLKHSQLVLVRKTHVETLT